MRAARGFTLVELLVAMVISAIIAFIGYRALDQAFRSRKEVDEQSSRLIALQQGLRIIEQDVELMQARPIRQPTGGGYLAAFLSSPAVGGTLGNSSGLGGTGLASSTDNTTTISTLGTISTLNGTSIPLVSFTRGGWSNPAGLPRSELQRVSYSIEDGVLVRSYTTELDATLSTPPIKRKLIDHVRRFGLRFMDAGHNWQTQWPAPGAGGADEQIKLLRFLPVAVEVTIEVEDWGVIVRRIEGPG